jgi:pyruvate kinase
MLDSMQHSQLPTRAEATDVANAILDGADACMLSGETAIGEYPCEAVEVMHRIAMATEPLVRERAASRQAELDPDDKEPITEATAHAAGRLAESLDAKMILVATASGRTALRLSKDRLFMPTVGVSESDVALRRMCLYWGVTPLAGAPTEGPGKLMEYMVRRGREAGYLASGDRVVLLAGTGLRVAEHNMIVVHELE